MNSPSEPGTIRVGGRYRLDERIGAGAMGVVWRGTDELLNRTVAVKELLAAAAPHTPAGEDSLEESRQRILREGRIGARLRHPHVISMFDVVLHDDRPWLVMEYLPSKSLAGVLAERGAVPPAELAAIGRQVADGLAAAHSAGVVHRDVKPGNVLIADDGTVKLTDFGVSRAVDEVQLTRTGLIAGTPAFLSPEVARGQDPTPASDVFALGATLYAAVEGEPPFGLDDNAYALLHKVATGETRPPRRAEQLTPVITWLLSPEPDDRPTAAQARDALAAIVAGRAAEVPAGAAAAAAPVDLRPRPAAAAAGPATVADLPQPEPAPAPPAAGSTRSRLPQIAAALVLLALVAGAAVLLIWGTGEAPQATQAAPPPVTATAAPVGTASPSAAAPTTTAAAINTAPSPTPEPSGAPPPGIDPVGFVQEYYNLLPGDTATAFGMLSSDAQAKSGGRAAYDGFYGGLQSVSLQALRKTGDNSAEATVVFVRRNGTVSSEAYRFVMTTGPNNQTIMESFSRA